MLIEKTTLPGVMLVTPKVFADSRGYFFESFNSQKFEEVLGKFSFCQDNESLSGRGVLRGLHYQLNPFAQTKLVRVIKGAIWDVAVDIRQNSTTFGKWFAIELNEDNKKQLLVPKGFAHGFQVLSDQALVQYKVDNLYSSAHDRGIKFDDPALNISWPLKTEISLSQKDSALPLFADAEAFTT